MYVCVCVYVRMYVNIFIFVFMNVCAFLTVYFCVDLVCLRFIGFASADFHSVETFLITHFGEIIFQSPAISCFIFLCLIN
jgi:hypothetical protein